MRAFLETIPERLRKSVHTFCTDMWEGYVNALSEFIAKHELKAAKIVVDRFHVAGHYRDGFDTLRKKELKRLKTELPEEIYERDCQGALWLLRHNYAGLSEEQKRQLRRLLAHSPQLHTAYTLRTELTAIFDMDLDREQGENRLLKWIAKAENSSLTCFESAIKTLNNHFNLIANYFIRRANSGFVEGFNNKLKVIKRRCYGIKNVSSLFQRLWLDTMGYARFA
ncbi:MAG: transposase [Hyphomicrobiales bacterium]|nr:transposase [Hyphomicrobiales bacterium]